MTVSIECPPAIHSPFRSNTIQAEDMEQIVFAWTMGSIETVQRSTIVSFGSYVPTSKEINVPQLIIEWKRQTRHISNIKKKASHPLYQQIINAGEVAVKHMLNDLKDNGPEDWFWALTSITGQNPITNDIAGNMSAMTEAWLAWGRKRGYLTD